MTRQFLIKPVPEGISGLEPAQQPPEGTSGLEPAEQPPEEAKWSGGVPTVEGLPLKPLDQTEGAPRTVIL